MGTTPRAASSRRGAIIDQRGGPRHGPPHPPTLGRAPAEPCRASEFAQARPSINVGGPPHDPPIPPPKAAPPPDPVPAGVSRNRVAISQPAHGGHASGRASAPLS